MKHRIGQSVPDLAYHSALNPSAREFTWMDKTGTRWKWSDRMKRWTYYSRDFQVWSGWYESPPPERGPYRCEKALGPPRRW